MLLFLDRFQERVVSFEPTYLSPADSYNPEQLESLFPVEQCSVHTKLA
jgi:hypothetical protein